MFDRERIKSDPGLLGAVDGGEGTKFRKQRKQGILKFLSRLRGDTDLRSSTEDKLDSAALGRGVTTDWYPREVVRGGRVSLEAAHQREQDMRDVLDGKVVTNNLGWDDQSTKGLKPCDLLEGTRGTPPRRGRR